MVFKDDKHVACGIWPLLLTETRFFNSCEWHDSAYTNGSVHQRKYSRYEIDRLFLLQMLEINKSYKFKWFHDLRAKLFYRLARMFGGFFWEGK